MTRKAEVSAAEQSKANTPRTDVGKGQGRKGSGGAKGEKPAPSSQRPVCEKCGQVHKKCNGHTRHGPNAGKPCGANPPAMQPLCIKHGGNHPAHKKKAKERLLELVDPALAALHKVLTDPTADDAVKVRAALGILDRTGFRPGVDVIVGVSKFDEMIGELAAESVRLDRTLPDDDRPALGSGGGADPMPLGFEDVEQHVANAQAEAWRESGYDREDAPPEHPFRDEHTVSGEVVGESYPGRYDVPRGRAPDAPPRYDPEGDA